MNMAEYQKVKDMTYHQYCDYLQAKYGIGLSDYMTASYNKNRKCSRTKDGLIAHHKMEDRAIKLSDAAFARHYPFEWQTKENIVYCDYLEHLLLHELICEHPQSENEFLFDVGIGGIVAYLVPELNDLYSGWVTQQLWRKRCHDAVRNDKDVYMAILAKLLEFEYTASDTAFDVKMLMQSCNAPLGTWDEVNNESLYDEIADIVRCGF